MQVVKTFLIDNAPFLIAGAVLVYLVVGAGGISGKFRKWKLKPRNKRRA